MKGERAVKSCYWGLLVHLGFNMWAEPETDRDGVRGIPQVFGPQTAAQYRLRFEEPLFWETLADLSEAGGNLLVLDIGEGMQYESHPELAVPGSYSKDALRELIVRARGMGFTVVPKLNFSTCHDFWMGPYARMVSTPEYYRFCEDVIGEVCEVFDNPPLFHLGMDEESETCQHYYNMVCFRRGELWWHDLNFLFRTVLRLGVRPWIWSDMIWDHEEEFLRRMSRDAVQSNWFYGQFPEGEAFSSRHTRAFRILEENRFDQIPTGCMMFRESNFPELSKILTPAIAPHHLLGFLQTTWYPMTETYREKHRISTKVLGDAVADSRAFR
ncbi:MAG: hypothetical protein J5494_02305 [Candidatus Methanomethylophilaceae archaeon]|nr:hypothetical protein [Candidatus Methanomethylophilaceae archaeon]